MYYYIITSVIFWCNFKLFQEHIRDVGWRKSQWVLRQNSFVVWQKNHIITYCQLTNIHWSLYSNHDFLELCCKEERPTTWHMCDIHQTWPATWSCRLSTYPRLLAPASPRVECLAILSMIQSHINTVPQYHRWHRQCFPHWEGESMDKSSLNDFSDIVVAWLIVFNISVCCVENVSSSQTEMKRNIL